jgi:hypothetical protein
MRRWEKLGDGRERLVIDAEDGTNPMYVYGKDREEILEKLATTVETGQSTIQRLRSTVAATPTASNSAHAPAQGAPQGPAAAPRRAQPTADDVMVAAADITNPAKAPQAARTLLRAAGIDVDGMVRDQSASRVARVGREWNAAHPDFPTDSRNSRMLIDRASLNVGFENISAQALDTAYAQLLAENMLFETEEGAPANGNGNTNGTEPAQPGGSQEPRTVRPRMATSYSRNQLTARTPAAQPKPKYTRAEIEAMNTRDFRAKVLDVPDVRAWYEREFSGAVA